MRILALTNLYPNPLQPQRATFNRRQLRLLNEHCPVRVLAPISWTDECRERLAGKSALPGNRQVHLDGLVIDHPRTYHTPGILRKYYGRLFYASVRKAFHRVCREFRPTIVLAAWVYPDGWAAVKLAREAGLPVVVKAHGSDLLLVDHYPGRKAGTVEAIQGADGIVTVSQDLAEKAITLGARPDKTRVIYNGLDRHVFHPGSKNEARQHLGLKNEKPALLFVGNLVPVKGVDLLLKACQWLSQRQQPFQLHVIGAGPLDNALKRQAVQLGLGDKVHWHGSVPHASLPNWYRAADVLVLPSRSEGVPNVLLEASGCRTPWVATRVGGIPEIAHVGAGTIVSSEAPEELAAAIRKTLHSPPRQGDSPCDSREAVATLSSFLREVQENYLGDVAPPARTAAGRPIHYSY